MDYKDITSQPWEMHSYGTGEWFVTSIGGYIVADLIPHGFVAEHIVRTHNETLDM